MVDCRICSGREFVSKRLQEVIARQTSEEEEEDILY
jgi:hypothetical protein